MAELNEKKPHAAIHQEARMRMGRIWNVVGPEREQCREDRRIATIPGASWDGALGEQFENKPQFEINKFPRACQKVVTDYRNNPITADFVSIEGKDSDKLAEVLDGLYRADEQDSGADEAYDNAFEEAALGGFGAYRFTSSFEDDEDIENEMQRIKIEPIYDADMTVFFDLGSKKQNKSDAQYAFVLTSFTQEEFKIKYGENVTGWPEPSRSYYDYDWVTKDAVIVAEYFRVETVDVQYVYFKMPDEDAPEERFKFSELDEDKLVEFAAMGMRETRTRTIKQRCVKKYTLCGDRVFGEPDVIPGKMIPVIPVYGKRWFLDGVERCAGQVRYAKDAARLHNMQVSRLAEISASSAIGKPILHPEQIAGHEDMWSDDAVENYAYLLINQMTGANGEVVPAGPIGYTKAPDLPPALVALHAMTKEDLEDILGNADGAEEIRSNVSKEVVQQIHARLDMQGYIYISNMSKSVAHGGNVWLSMTADVYVEDGRVMKTVGEDGQTSTIEINRPKVDDDGVLSQLNLGTAKFNVHTKVAPASSSRKAATVRICTEMMAVIKDPEGQRVLSLTAMMNMEGEGISGLQKHARRQLVEMGIVTPTPEEAQEMKARQEASAQKSDPQAEYLLAEARKSEAQAKQAEAAIEKARADAEKAKAQTMSILAGIEPGQTRLLLDTMKELSDMGSRPAQIMQGQPTIAEPQTA